MESGTTRENKTDIMWTVASAAVIVIAAFLRFYDLALKPLHHDEGVNGWFLTNLFRHGSYSYDPTNYHGPTLYFIALPFAQMFGLETVPIRASVAVFGVLMVVLALFLKRYIGKTGALSAAAFLAVSPGMVFISRYFIHEIFFVFLALTLVVSVLFFIDRPRVGPFAIFWTALLFAVCFLPPVLRLATKIADGNTTTLWSMRIGFTLLEGILIGTIIVMLVKWRDGQPIYLILAAASAALMFATKETAFITLGTMLIALGCIWIYRKVFPPKTAPADGEISDEISFRKFAEATGTGIDRTLLFIAASAAFIYVFIVFFSSFFSYPEGVRKSFEAYAVWTKTGTKDHVYSYLHYIYWGWNYEGPVMLLAVVGAAFAFIKRNNKFAMFAALWAFGLFAAYSIIPYKTPWLALSFLLPMAIASGYAINEIAKMGFGGAKAIAGVLAFAAIGFMGYRAYELSFVNYDDNSQTYIYAHTRRGFHDMMDKLYYYADKSGKGKDAVVDVVSQDYWPMVWYVKDYPGVVFQGHIIPVRRPEPAEMIVAEKGEQDAEAMRDYSADYKLAGVYPLRPGVDLMLLVRNDLADADTQDLSRIPYTKPRS